MYVNKSTYITTGLTRKQCAHCRGDKSKRYTREKYSCRFVDKAQGEAKNNNYPVSAKGEWIYAQESADPPDGE